MRNLHSRLLGFILLAVMMMAGNVSVWGENVTIKTLDWSSSDWSSHSDICKTSNEEVVNGVKFTRSKNTDGDGYKISGGVLTFTNDGNAQNSNRWIAVPLENINGSITVNIAAVSGKQLQVKYQLIEGSTAFSEPTSLTASDKPSAGNPLSFTISDITSDKAVLYFGRNGSNQTQVGAITITTPSSSGGGSSTQTPLSGGHIYQKIYIGKSTSSENFTFTPSTNENYLKITKGGAAATYNTDYTMSYALTSGNSISLNETTTGKVTSTTTLGESVVTATVTPTAAISETYSGFTFPFTYVVTDRKSNSAGVDGLTALDKAWTWTPEDVNNGRYYQDYHAGDGTNDYIFVKSSDTGNSGVRAKLQSNAQIAFKLGTKMNVTISSNEASDRHLVISTADNATSVVQSGNDNVASYTFTLEAGTYYIGAQKTDNSITQLYVKSIAFEPYSEVTLSSIAVKTAPTKTTYTAGEYFDPTGLVITKTMSDSSTSDVSYASESSNFSFSPTTSTALTTGNTSVTITYGGKTTSQAITVNAVVAPPTATFLYGTSATTGTQWESPAVDEMTITVPAHKANQDFTVTVTPENGANILNCENASANQNVVTITAPDAGSNKTVTIPVAKSGNQTNYTIVVKTEASVGSNTFNENTRYSKLVINANIGSFYGNTALKGFNTYDENGNKTATASWKNSSGNSANVAIDYVAGLVAKGIIEAADYYSTTDPANAKAWYYSIADYGNSITVPTGGGSLDDLNASKLFFGLYDLTKTGGAFNGLSNASTVNSTASTKLGNALAGLSAHNSTYSFGATNYTSNSSIGGTDLTGGWFHKSSYLYQMWCDGAYMGPALLAQLNNYGKKINNSGDWDLITKQFELTWGQLWNSTDKLLYHAFTSKQDVASYTATWAGNAERTQTLAQAGVYHSAEYWGRADGWYFLALVDVLEQMQKANISTSDANYVKLKGYLSDLAAGLKERQDATTGCWYQLLGKDDKFSATDCGNGATTNRVYNFLESSATAIFTAAYFKAIRLGLLDKATYGPIAKKAYKGIVENFMSDDYKLYWTSRSAGLGGAASGAKLRDGSSAYYLKGYDVNPTKVTDNGSKDETGQSTLRKGTEGKTLGAFIMAATEYERAYLDAPVAGYTANFNGNGKTITITSLKEPNKGQGIILPAAAYTSDEIAAGTWKNASNGDAGAASTSFVPEEGYYEVYRNAYDNSIGNVLTQTINGLSNDAQYEIVLSVGASFTSNRGFTCPIGNDLTEVFAGSKSVNLPVYDRSTLTNDNKDKVVFVVSPTDGSITFGLRNIAPSGNWFVAKLESIKKVDNSDFGGWYYDPACTSNTKVGDAGDNAMVDNDGKIFYAKWNSGSSTSVGSTTVQISRNYAWGWLTEKDKVTSIDLSAAATALGCEASAMKLLLWNGSDYVEATNNANYSPIIDDSSTKDNTNIGSWFTQDGNITDWGNNNYWFATINDTHTKIYVAHMMNMEANPVGNEAFGTTFRLTNADGSKYYDITLEGKILQKYVAPTITINGNWVTISQPEGQGGKMYYKYGLQKPGDVTTENYDGSTTENKVSFFIPFATYTDGWIQAYCQDEQITNIYASGCRTSDITKYGEYTVIPNKPTITQGTGSEKNKVTITVPDNVYDRSGISPFYIEYKINGGESQYADNEKSVVIDLLENSTISAQIGCYYQKKDYDYSETLSDHWSVSGFAELAVVLDASTVITPEGTKVVNVAKEYNDGWATTAVEIPNFSEITTALGESPVFAYMSNGQLILNNGSNTNAGAEENSKGWFFTQGGSVITSSSLSTDAYYSVSYSTSTHKLYIGLTEGCASYTGSETAFGGDVYLANADGSKCYKITISGTINKGVKSIKIGHTTITDVAFTDKAFDTQLKFYGYPTIEVTLSDDTKPTLTHNRVDDLSQISTATFSMNGQTYTINYKMKNVSAEALTAVSSETSWNFESGNDPYALTIGTEIITNMNWGNIMLFASEAAHLHIGGRGSAILQTIGAGQKTSRSIAIKVAGAGTFTFNNGTIACPVKVLNDAGEEVGSFIAEKGANNNVWNDSKFTYVGDASVLYFVPQRSTGIERLNRVTYSPLSTYLKSVTVGGASLDVTTLVNTGSITVDTRYYEAPTVNYTYVEDGVQKSGETTPDANGVCTITVGGVDYTINFTNIKSATALTVTHPYTKVYLGKKSTDGYTPRGDVWTVYKGDDKAEESDYSFSTATSNEGLLTVNTTSGNIKPASKATGSAKVTVTAAPSASLEGFAAGTFVYDVNVSQQSDENHTGVEALTALDESWSWTPEDVKSGVYYQDYFIGDGSADYIMVKSSDTGSDGIRAKAQENAQIAFKLGATMKVKIYNKANASRYWVLSTENSSDIADYTYGSNTDLNQPYATVILSAGTYYLGAKDASSNAATQLYLQKIEFEKIETQTTGDNYEIIFNNGATHKKNGNVIDSDYYFTLSGKIEYNSNYSGKCYDNTISKGLKMQSETTISFTTKSQTAKVIVVQSTKNYSSNTFSFDGNAQDSGTPVSGEETYAKEFIIENVAAGSHTITRTKSEMGLLYIKVIEGEILPYVKYTDDSAGDHTKPYTVSLDVAKANEGVDYTIYYTTNGKKPTPEDKLTYDGSPIQINTTTTITAVPVWNSNASEGEVTSETFEVIPDYGITISATDVQHTSQHTVGITDVIKGTTVSGATTNLSEGENKVASINVTITVSGTGLAYIMYGVNGPESENVYVEAIDGTATVTLKAQQFKDATSYSIIGYDEYGNASEEFTHTYMLYEPMLYRPVAGSEAPTPGKPRPIYLDDDTDKGIAVTMISGTNIGWDTLDANVWGTTARKSQESVTGAMDGMVVTATTASDAYTEKAITNDNGISGEAGRKAQVYGSNLNNEFDLPVLGAFYKFYPKMKGTLSVYVLVNGPEEVKNKVQNANVCRHRRIYVQDETGSVVPFTVESSNEAFIGTRFFNINDPEVENPDLQEQGEAAPGNESDLKTYKWLLSKLQANWTTWGNEGSAPATIKELRAYGQTNGKTIKHKAWINNAASNASTIDDGKPINDNSIEVIAKSFVKINIPVMPGKTYYISGNMTKVACSGFKFAPDARQPQVQTITMGGTATPTLTANTVANVTVNRTFTANKWTSLVLPFSVSEVQLQEMFGSNVSAIDEIAAGTKMLNQQNVTTFHFNGATGNKLNLYEHYYDMVRAGRPIFIRPTKTVENPVFKNVTIEKTDVEADLTGASDADDNGGYMVTGRYSYLENNAPIGSYYLTTNKTTGTTSFSTNTTKAVTVKPTIAYIKPETSALQSKKLVVKVQSVIEDGVGFDEATGILDVFEDMGVDAVVVTSSTKVFNTQGQVVAEGIDSLDELPTGIYIVNGKKYVVK